MVAHWVLRKANGLASEQDVGGAADRRVPLEREGFPTRERQHPATKPLTGGIPTNNVTDLK
jgi:hypothetical protein